MKLKYMHCHDNSKWTYTFSEPLVGMPYAVHEVQPILPVLSIGTLLVQTLEGVVYRLQLLTLQRLKVLHTDDEVLCMRREGGSVVRNRRERGCGEE